MRCRLLDNIVVMLLQWKVFELDDLLNVAYFLHFDHIQCNLTPVGCRNSFATLGPAMKRLRLGFVTMKRSCQTVLLRGRPKRCRPLTFPAVLNRFKSRHGVNGCTLNFWTTSLCEQPVVYIPRARCRLFSESFGRFPITCFCNFSPAFL